MNNWKAYWIVPKGDDPQDIKEYTEKIINAMNSDPAPGIEMGFTAVEDDTGKPICVLSSNNKKTARSTARLIAAAPDLLEASRAALDFSIKEDNTPVAAVIRAAIDKAIKGK